MKSKDILISRPGIITIPSRKLYIFKLFYTIGERRAKCDFLKGGLVVGILDEGEDFFIKMLFVIWEAIFNS